MPNITITIPAGVVADARAVLQALYSEEAAGLTDKQLLALHLRRTLGPHIKARRQAKVDFTAVEAARVAVEQALIDEEAARKTALKAAETQAATDVEGVV